VSVEQLQDCVGNVTGCAKFREGFLLFHARFAELHSNGVAHKLLHKCGKRFFVGSALLEFCQRLGTWRCN